MVVPPSPVVPGPGDVDEDDLLLVVPHPQSPASMATPTPTSARDSSTLLSFDNDFASNVKPVRNDDVDFGFGFDDFVSPIPPNVTMSSSTIHSAPRKPSVGFGHSSVLSEDFGDFGSAPVSAQTTGNRDWPTIGSDFTVKSSSPNPYGFPTSPPLPALPALTSPPSSAAPTPPSKSQSPFHNGMTRNGPAHGFLLHKARTMSTSSAASSSSLSSAQLRADGSVGVSGVGVGAGTTGPLGSGGRSDSPDPTPSSLPGPAPITSSVQSRPPSSLGRLGSTMNNAPLLGSASAPMPTPRPLTPNTLTFDFLKPVSSSSSYLTSHSTLGGGLSRSGTPTIVGTLSPNVTGGSYTSTTASSTRQSNAHFPPPPSTVRNKIASPQTSSYPSSTTATLSFEGNLFDDSTSESLFTPVSVSIVQPASSGTAAQEKGGLSAQDLSFFEGL